MGGTLKRYVQRLPEIEAIQITAEDREEILKLDDVSPTQEETSLLVRTSSGPRIAKIGDWLCVSGGGIFLRSDKEFRATYAPIPYPTKEVE